MSEITLALQAVGRGEAQSADALLPLVYEQLRRLAAARLAQEAPGQTLQATALVDESWLRLVTDHDQQWENRAHFFGAAAEAMRRIMIEMPGASPASSEAATFCGSILPISAWLKPHPTTRS